MPPRKKVTETEQVPEQTSEQLESTVNRESSTGSLNSALPATATSWSSTTRNAVSHRKTVKMSSGTTFPAALHTRKILTGVVSGIETLENGNIVCAVGF